MDGMGLAQSSNRPEATQGADQLMWQKAASIRSPVALVFAAIMFVVGCSQPPTQVMELKRFPLNDLEGVLSRSDVEFDRAVSSDGGGSVRISVTQPTVVRLFELGDLDIENARLIYQAKVRTQGVNGQVYLEMWCRFPGKGEFFSRGLQTPVSGTTDWTTEETPFFLQKGENPDNIKLNLVMNGTGTAWIDDIRLLRGSLQ